MPAIALLLFLLAWTSPLGAQGFRAELFEDVSSDSTASLSAASTPALQWNTPFLGIASVPPRLSPAGMSVRRSKPFGIRLSGNVNLAAGDYEFLLRSRVHTRVYIDGVQVLAAERPKPVKLTPEQVAAQEAADKKAREEAAVKQVERDQKEADLQRRLEQFKSEAKDLKAVQEELDKVRGGDQLSDSEPPAAMESVSAKRTLQAGAHHFRIELVAARGPGEVSLSFRAGNNDYELVGGEGIRFSQKGWADWQQKSSDSINAAVAEVRKPLQENWNRYWQARRGTAPASSSNPAGTSIDSLLNAGYRAAALAPAPLITDLEFVRRVYLDIWGVIPTAKEVEQFIRDRRKDKRSALIRTLLRDDRWADPWVGYWEDVLAENPVIYGTVPHSTGAFKNWIHNSFVANHGFDRFATELILMEGDDKEAGTLGFETSAGDDLPPAEKAMVISQAFLSANMKCARCHDSPVNEFRQRDLFGIGAVLHGKSLVVPATSSVGEVPGRRKPAVTVTSKPGDAIPPSFIFDASFESIADDLRSTRLKFAESLTAHRRFAQTGVNRIWKRFMGTGLVEPVDNWPRKPKPSNVELLEFLTDEFRASGFDVRHVQELILNSEAYQRRRNPALAAAKDSNGNILFAAQPARRMRAEEIVDSLHRAVGRQFKSERMAYASVDYGFPKKTWQLVTLSNEEDNAILVRPVLQEILTTASMFGWRDQRPDSQTVRNDDPNPLQPLTLANGTLISRLIRLTDTSRFSALAESEIGIDQFIDQLFLSILSRPPSAVDRKWARRLLEPAWSTRKVAKSATTNKPGQSIENVSYKDMLDAYRYIEESRKLEPPAAGLSKAFRAAAEDALWVMFNTPEFLFVP